MVNSSAFHPYIRPTLQPTEQQDESSRFAFTPEALIALSQLQNAAALVQLSTDSPKDTSPPLLTPNQITPSSTSSTSSVVVTVPLTDSIQSPTNNVPNEKSRRKRTTFSPEQATRLEAEYLADSYMAREKRLQLAHSLNLSENQVKTWFQNRRAKDKRDRKTDNSSIQSRKSSPSRKSSSDSSPTPSVISTGSFILPTSHIQTASSPTTVEALLSCSPSTPPARIIQKVEQFSVQPHMANILLPTIGTLHNYLQSFSSGSQLQPPVHSILSTPPPLFNQSILSSFHSPLQSATI